MLLKVTGTAPGLSPRAALMKNWTRCSWVRWPSTHWHQITLYSGAEEKSKF